MVREEINKKTDDLEARQCMAGYVATCVWCIETQREAEVGNRETKARRLRGIQAYDEDARRKLEVLMPAAMLCRLQLHKHRETCCTAGQHDDENMLVLSRQTNLWGYAWKGLKASTMKTTSQGETWIHWVTFISCKKLFPCLKPWKHQKQKAAMEKELEKKLEKILEWQLTKVRNKNDVIAEARNKGHTVHFASSMDLCHLKNSELEPQFQKYKGRVVPRGNIVKDDSGSYAVFTEQRIISFTNDGC